jgi:hypothetical protein
MPRPSGRRFPLLMDILLFTLLSLQVQFGFFHLAHPSVSFGCDSSLSDAMSHLNLPTWSRGYVLCTDVHSELTCDSVIRASAAVRDWESRATFSNVVHTSLDALGLCNRAILDMTAVVIGMMTDSVVRVQALVQAGRRHWRSRNAYDYPPGGLISYGAPSSKCSGPHRTIPVIDFLSEMDWPSNGTHFVLQEPFMPTLLYLHPLFGPFVTEAFGFHAQHFLLNYICRIPAASLAVVLAAVASLPANVRLFGIHIRWHSARHFYLPSINGTLELLLPFCDDAAAQTPTIFVVASDSFAMVEQLRARLNVFALDVYRKSDGDHFSAILDLALLMYCNEFLATARSTFSAMVHARTGRAPWVIEHGARTIWRASSSQIGHCLNPYSLAKEEERLFELAMLAHVRTQGNVEQLRHYYRVFAM